MKLVSNSVAKSVVRCSTLALGAILTASLFAPEARAVTLKAGPTSPQPGDVLTITVWPHAGEKIKAVGMAAFDTQQVKFYSRRDGTARAYLGFPFDRSGGAFTLRARVQFEHGGRLQEQVVTTTLNGRSRYFPTQRIRMSGSTAKTMSRTDALRKEKQHVQSKMKNSHPSPLWSGNWIVPARGKSSSAYGRKRYVNGRWWGQHSGADIKAGAGTTVLASNSGRVVLSEYLPTLRGNTVVIDHGCNVYSIYMHLRQRNVRVGDSVARGAKIGEVGSTGFSTGPHLHWEIRVGWEPVDPFKVVESGLNF